MREPRPAVLCLTAAALPLAEQVAALAGGEVHGRAGRVETAILFDNAPEHLRALFAAGRPIIGLCAAGILIRALAPLILAKAAEPPVLALAEDGSAAVPLLGGHRGANALARLLEEGLRQQGLDARAAITTAGDLRLGVALDAPPPPWRLTNPEDAPAAMAALLAAGEGAISGPPFQGETESDRVEIAIGAHRLVYKRAIYALGMGCARGADPEEAIALAEALLAEHPDGAVAGIFSLNLKMDEAAIHAVAERLGIPARFFDAAALEAEAPRLAHPSETVFAEVGCHGVAEGAALAAVGPAGRLVAPKRKIAAVTAALAEAPGGLVGSPGARRGRLSVVGIGPGFAEGRTPEASRAIAEAEELVGYGLYLDLLGPAAAGKIRADFPLGGEEARCRHALEAAGDGRAVALVCSGDAGIYAMGALVMELLDRAPEEGGVGPAARRAEIRMIPGVSALQTASARAGALIGHDFCAISLSDLLTPWETIEARIEAAARGDFVIAFYNPVSKRRRTQLARAKEILLAHRPEETPVLLAGDLGRPAESLRRRRLADLDVDEVDMLTTVLVGAAASRLVPSGDHRAGAEGAWLYTPRGYARKIDR